MNLVKFFLIVFIFAAYSSHAANDLANAKILHLNGVITTEPKHYFAKDQRLESYNFFIKTNDNFTYYVNFYVKKFGIKISNFNYKMGDSIELTGEWHRAQNSRSRRKNYKGSLYINDKTQSELLDLKK